MSKRYKRLIKLQQLLQKRDEALLNEANSTYQALQREKQHLLSAQQQLGVNLNHLLWMAQRLRKNAVKEQETIKIIAKRQNLVRQSWHRRDILAQKKRACENRDNQKNFMAEISEYLSVQPKAN